MCLRFLKPPSLWFQNRTDDFLLFSPASSKSFDSIKSIIQLYTQHMYDIFYVGNKVASWPTTQTSMTALHRLYVIRNNLNWHNKQGIGYTTALYSSDMAWLSSIECYISSVWGVGLDVVEENVLKRKNMVMGTGEVRIGRGMVGWSRRGGGGIRGGGSRGGEINMKQVWENMWNFK